MSDKDLGKALLNLDAGGVAGTPEVRAQVALLLARDRARVKFWTLTSAVVGGLAGLMVLAVVVLFGFLFPLQAHLNDAGVRTRVAPAEHARMQEDAQAMFMMGTLLIAVAVVVLAVAALATLALVLASRQAILRQVNASLIEVSEELKLLRLTAESRPAAGTDSATAAGPPPAS